MGWYKKTKTEPKLNNSFGINDLEQMQQQGFIEQAKQFDPNDIMFAGFVQTCHAVLRKVASMGLSAINCGYDIISGNRVANHNRQYEWKLDGYANYSVCPVLIVKDKSFSYHNELIMGGNWQLIVLDLETLSKLTVEELTTIYFDLD